MSMFPRRSLSPSRKKEYPKLLKNAEKTERRVPKLLHNLFDIFFLSGHGVVQKGMINVVGKNIVLNPRLENELGPSRTRRGTTRNIYASLGEILVVERITILYVPKEEEKVGLDFLKLVVGTDASVERILHSLNCMTRSRCSTIR